MKAAHNSKAAAMTSETRPIALRRYCRFISARKRLTSRRAARKCVHVASRRKLAPDRALAIG